MLILLLALIVLVFAANQFNASSEDSDQTGRYANDSRTAREIIGSEKRGGIWSEFPAQWANKTYSEIKKAADGGDKDARKAKKLLDRKEYDKDAKT